MALLEVSNLEKRFGGIIATNNVSFTVDNHEILGLIGPNGAGKSTILHLIIGIHKPTSGTIKFEGQDIQKLPILYIKGLKKVSLLCFNTQGHWAAKMCWKISSSLYCPINLN